MVMWFNVRKARKHLLEKGFVVTLRPKPYRLRGKKVRGRDILCYDGFGKKGEIFFDFIKTVKDDSELREFVEYSGFKDIEEWAREAKDNRCLFYVMLLDAWDLEHVNLEA